MAVGAPRRRRGGASAAPAALRRGPAAIALAVACSPSAEAATGDAGAAFGRVLPWLGLLVLVIVVGGIVVAMIRRAATSEGEELSGGGFTLHDLREMRRRGELTEEEFEQAYAGAVARARGATGDAGAAAGDETDASAGP